MCGGAKLEAVEVERRCVGVWGEVQRKGWETPGSDVTSGQASKNPYRPERPVERDRSDSAEADALVGGLHDREAETKGTQGWGAKGRKGSHARERGETR